MGRGTQFCSGGRAGLSKRRWSSFPPRTAGPGCGLPTPLGVPACPLSQWYLLSLPGTWMTVTHPPARGDTRRLHVLLETKSTSRPSGWWLPHMVRPEMMREEELGPQHLFLEGPLPVLAGASALKRNVESSPFTENRIQHDFMLTEEGIPSSCSIEAHLSSMSSWAVSPASPDCPTPVLRM